MHHNLLVPETLAYDLHKLGWRAFQDLSAIVLQSALGQTFHTFADSNDGGRDGAFYGGWAANETDELSNLPVEIANATAVVAQCKFSASGVGTLPPSELRGELEKVERLHVRGLCDSYILVTNLRVSGNTEAWLRDELGRRGVSQAMILDGAWICQQITVRPALRRNVPRIYGLGDLGQILDDRRLEQAKLLLSNLGGDLGTFVPTSAYRQAADALADHGFTILLGAPAAGKSTIAATLSAVALDEWGCGVRRVDSPAELVAAWNPHEPDQLFWVDDAFGAIRHDQQLTDQWSRRLDQVMVAVQNGARIILTSRDYIYRQARVHLKEYAYPLLRGQAVVVDVAQLSDEERRQILYNHLRSGDQPSAKLHGWRPYLGRVASSATFQPEIARRLSRQAFTGGIAHGGQLLTYVERPVDVLKDVLQQLEPAARAALACVYLSGSGLPLPVHLSGQDAETVALLGATTAEVMGAFALLNETFLALISEDSGHVKWQFRHPTIREGFAAAIAEDPNAVHILVNGLSNQELIRQVDCGGTDAGTLVTIPASLYEEVVSRTRLSDALADDYWYSPLGEFLTRRCSDAFLDLWAQVNSDDLPRLLELPYIASSSWRLSVLSRLHTAGVLSAELRDRAVDRLEQQATEYLDGTWLSPKIVGLFTPQEVTALLSRFSSEMLPQIDDLIYESADGYDNDVSPAQRFEEAQSTIKAYLAAFDDVPEISVVLTATLDRIDSMIAEAEEEFRPKPSESFAPVRHLPSPPTARDQFDDVHVGH